MHIGEAVILREAQRLRHETVAQAILTFHNWLANYRRTNASRHEFSIFSPVEMAALARDTHLEPSQLRALSNVGVGGAKFLKRMLAALGIDPETVETMDARTARDLQTTCSLCTSKLRCRRALATGTAAKTYREFCPNAATLGALTA